MSSTHFQPRMPRESNCTRNMVYNTGYFLIIDFSSQMELELIDRIVEVVSDVLAVACCSKGVCRISYFGIGVINSQFEVVWKLSRLKGHYIKITKSLSSLKKIVESAIITEEDFFDYLHFGIKSALNQVDELTQSSSCESMNDLKTRLNVVLLTKKDGFGVRFFLKSLLELNNHQKLQQIKVVELSDSIQYNSIKDGIIHLIQMNNKTMSLEKLFKSWLVDLSFDREDLIIKICGYELKCDVHEVILDTSLVPFAASFHIHKEIANSSTTHLPDPVMPVYTLEALERISSSGISESSVFGCPMQIRPTQVCKEDQFDYGLNTQRFKALCKILYDADEYLITKLASNNSPNGYFVLMPGDGMFLVKSLSSRELMLPLLKSSDCDDNNNNPLYEVKLEMSNVVFGLRLFDEYDPFRLQSGICSFLRRQLQPPNPESSVCDEMNSLQSKSKSFNQSNIRKKSRLHPYTSTNKKQQSNNKPLSDIKLLKHLGDIR